MISCASERAVARFSHSSRGSVVWKGNPSLKQLERRPDLRAKPPPAASQPSARAASVRFLILLWVLDANSSGAERPTSKADRYQPCALISQLANQFEQRLSSVKLRRCSSQQSFR